MEDQGVKYASYGLLMCSLIWNKDALGSMEMDQIWLIWNEYIFFDLFMFWKIYDDVWL